MDDLIWEESASSRHRLKYNNIPTFWCKCYTRPACKVEIIDKKDGKHFLSEKYEWLPLEITLFDSIELESANKFIEWTRSTDKENLILEKYDPAGTITETWHLINSQVLVNEFISTNKENEYYIKLQLKFEYAIKSI